MKNAYSAVKSDMQNSMTMFTLFQSVFQETIMSGDYLFFKEIL